VQVLRRSWKQFQQILERIRCANATNHRVGSYLGNLALLSRLKKLETELTFDFGQTQVFLNYHKLHSPRS